MHGGPICRSEALHFSLMVWVGKCQNCMVKVSVSTMDSVHTGLDVFVSDLFAG